MLEACIIPSGTAYGVALNDAELVNNWAAAFSAAPYKAPPRSPVLYVKPRSCFSVGGAAIPLPADVSRVQVAATVAILFAGDLCRAGPEAVRASIGAACLALDVSEPCDSYYRPPVRQQCRDGFLPMGRFAGLPESFAEIVTEIDGVEVHRWSLERLLRPLEALAADISGFMTLGAGDLLLLGLAGDAPTATAGQSIKVSSRGLPALQTRVVPESAS